MEAPCSQGRCSASPSCHEEGRTTTSPPSLWAESTSEPSSSRKGAGSAKRRRRSASSGPWTPRPCVPFSPASTRRRVSCSLPITTGCASWPTTARTRPRSRSACCTRSDPRRFAPRCGPATRRRRQRRSGTSNDVGRGFAARTGPAWNDRRCRRGASRLQPSCIARAAPLIRIFTPTCSSRTLRPGRTADGLRSTPGACSSSWGPHETCTRPNCVRSSPAGSASRGASSKGPGETSPGSPRR